MRAVGIDLGTSNIVVASANVERSAGVAIFDVIQRTGLDEQRPLPLYPSSLYAPIANELLSDPFGEAPWASGAWAKLRSSETSGRSVGSAKSWLCHAGVDRTAAFLPHGADDSVPRISPLDASAVFLRHVRTAWDRENEPLAHEHVILTVPASFDESARALTLRAATMAGLRVRLLEEPLAAFHDCIANDAHIGMLTKIAAAAGGTTHVLVCDVGGGTTDLSLVRATVGPAGLVCTRAAVGRHLLLGGDNMDLALAHTLEKEIGALDPMRFSQLVALARSAKETLLGEGDSAEAKIRIAGAGSSLVGNVVSATLTREQAHAIVLEGFFPIVTDAMAPVRAALVGFGLPYESDPAITRHIARFLERHRSMDLGAVLLNGGVFRASRIAERTLEAIGALVSHPVARLPESNPDLAVATGAVRFALGRQGFGRVVEAPSAFAYYAGVDNRAVCILARGTAEGTTVSVPQTFTLTVGKPARFELFASDERTDAVGDIVERDSLTRLPPVLTRLDDTTAKRGAEKAVTLEASLTDIGTVALACVDGQTRHELTFELRPRDRPSTLPPPSSTGGRALAEAQAMIERVFGKKASSEARTVKDLARDLERALGDRSKWTAPTLRSLFDVLAMHPGARRRTADHERVFFQLAGYTGRPGFGDPGDPERAQLMTRLFPERLGFPNEARGWQQLAVCYRRISGGLSAEAQISIFDALVSSIDASSSKKSKSLAPTETIELLASLERVDKKRRAALGEILTERTFSRDDVYLWACIGRIAARVPAYGSAHETVDSTIAERWIEQLLRSKWALESTQARAAVAMARLSGDRARDVSARMRKDVERRLVSLAAPEEMLAPLREVTSDVAVARADVFGDALPLGLKLAE